MDCHCNQCGWEGYWDDADVTSESEERGEAFGSPTYIDVNSYSCPLCGQELEAGPFPSSEDDEDLTDDEDDEVVWPDVKSETVH